MSKRLPGEGRYAHAEREQRWLLPRRPPGCVDPALIVDRYVVGTTLRLRQVEDGAGQSVYKMGQKVRPHSESPELVRLTNIYLRVDEYQLLTSLPALGLRKTRWHLHDGDLVFVVDEFKDELAGLILAELELLPGEARMALPNWASLDVTDDDRYSGGRLAAVAADGDAAAQLLGLR
jgi:CYTH domain-containing protein